MKLRKIVRRMSRMCEPAWYVFRRCLQLAAFLLACGLLLTTGGQVHTLMKTASALNETAEAVLQIGAIFPVLLEDQHSRR